jgi:hypothetical protein
MPEEKVIEVYERLISEEIKTRKFQAQLQRHPQIWSRGDTAYEAIGQLIADNQEHFGVSIVDVGPR